LREKKKIETRYLLPTSQLCQHCHAMFVISAER